MLIQTTRTFAIGKIDVVRMHAAEIYVAPAIGELFDCKSWRDHAESIFFGPWADVERAHAMLAAIRSAMEREFADFIETRTVGENWRTLAGSFSKGMGQQISERLRHLKARQTAAGSILAGGKDLAAAPARMFRDALRKSTRRRTPSSTTMAYAAGVEAGNRVALSAV
jgi:hypothetical protein